MRAIAAVSSCALVAVLALAGCGASSHSDGRNSDAATLLATTSDKTAAAKNAKIDIALVYESDQGDTTLNGSGIADLADHGYRLSIKAPAGRTGSVDEVAIGGNIWIKVPDEARFQTAGKPWVAVSTGSSAADAYNQDPTAYLRTLKHVNAGIVTKGTKTLHGVRTTHYQARMSLADSEKLSGMSSESAKTLASKVDDTVPTDVYLDDQGLTRRVEMQFTYPERGSTPAMKMHMIMDYYDFGKANTSEIVAPPAADTIAASETTLFG